MDREAGSDLFGDAQSQKKNALSPPPQAPRNGNGGWECMDGLKEFSI